MSVEKNSPSYIRSLVRKYLDTKEANLLGEVYLLCEKKVFHYCLGYVKEKNMAKDITQDVFLKVLENLANLKNPDTFDSWLFTITRNQCIDYLKSNKLGKKVDEKELDNLEEEFFDEEAAMDREKLLDKLEEVVLGVPEEIKELVIARYFEKKSIKELQEQLNLSESAVKMRLTRARKLLAKLLDLS